MIRIAMLALVLLSAQPVMAKDAWTFSDSGRVTKDGPHILVIYDMEGLSGQDDPTTWMSEYPSQYAQGQRLLTDDVNAVISGLFEGGARHVSVADGHGGGNLHDDILVDQVDKRARIVRGKLDGYSDLAKAGAYDGVAAVAMHAKSGSGGFSAHTWTLGIEIVVNGRSVDETQLLALGYGEAGIPVIFASGDDRLGQELEDLPWLEYVAVKEATGPASAKLYPVPETRKRLTAGAKRAVERLPQAKVLTVSKPVEMTVRAFPPADLSWLANMPGIHYEDQAVSFTAPDFAAAYKGMQPVGAAAYQAFFKTTSDAVEAHPDGKQIERRAVEELMRTWKQTEITRAKR